MELNRSILILVCSLVCLALSTLSCHEIASEQVVESVPENQFNQGLIATLRSVYKNARDYLGQKLIQLYGTFDSAKVSAFEKFTRSYNKQYSDFELPRRMRLFFERKRLVDESQRLYKQGKAPFEMKLNKFADLDESEMRLSGGGSKRPPEEKIDEIIKHEIGDYGIDLSQEQEFTDSDGIKESQAAKSDENFTRLLSDVPSSKDWRETGCFAEPIDQRECGSCYAISTMSMVDSMLCMRGFTEKPQNLSTQQIIDCAKKNYFNDNYYNEGCKVGWPSSVLAYLQEEGVALKENCYPYANMENTDCLSKRLMRKRNCTVDINFSHKVIPYKVLHGERSILYHVAKYGPVVVTVFVTRNFRLYSAGIFEDDECNEKNYEVLRTHALLIVGYGQEMGVDYWIIKNSWGPEWGIGGYGRIRRGVNVCNIGSIFWTLTP